MSAETQNQLTPSKFWSETITLPIKRPFDWKVFIFLVAIITPASYLILPYAFTLQGTEVPPGDWPIVTLATASNALIYSAAGFLGLLLAARIGLGLPFVEGRLAGDPPTARFRSTLFLAIAIGVIAALIILALGMWVFKPLMLAELDSLGIALSDDVQPAPWKGFLASFYGGIIEEVQMRLLLMSLLAWLGGLLSKDAEGRPSPAVMWGANILAAILFGLGHLPATAGIGLPMSPLIITRAIVLNGIGGVAFGWLYWKRGLESAMIAHFSADIVVHVITPAIAVLFISS